MSLVTLTGQLLRTAVDDLLACRGLLTRKRSLNRRRSGDNKRKATMRDDDDKAWVPRRAARRSNVSMRQSAFQKPVASPNSEAESL